MIACLGDSAEEVRDAVDEMKKGRREVLKVALELTTRLGLENATIALMESLQDPISKLVGDDQSLLEYAVILQNWDMAHALLDAAEDSELNVKAIFENRNTEGYGNILGLATLCPVGYPAKQQQFINRLIEIRPDYRVIEEDEDPLQNAVSANSRSIVQNLTQTFPLISEKSFLAAVKQADTLCTMAGDIRGLVVDTMRKRYPSNLKRKADVASISSEGTSFFSELNGHVRKRKL
jgi:hypothetical protein